MLMEDKKKHSLHFVLINGISIEEGLDLNTGGIHDENLSSKKFSPVIDFRSIIK